MVKNVLIKTFGCAHNMADSEAMAHYLVKAGYKVSFDEDFPADIVVINTCTVKNPTEDKFFSLLKKETRAVVVAGCIPQAQSDDDRLKNYCLLGIDQIHRISEAVEFALQHHGSSSMRQGETKHFLDRSKNFEDYPEQPEGCEWHRRSFLPSIRKNKFIAIIPIAQGCLGSCTYCKTKQARGILKSYSKEIIVKQIRLAKAEGIKEIRLVSEDNGAWGLDRNETFPQLLNAIVDVADGLKIRVGMLNAQYAFIYKEELAELLQNDCFYKFLHVPIQSADNQVLKDMNRQYTIEQFEIAIKIIKEKNPHLSLATDIICGYPTESEEQWNNTMNFLKRFPFNTINISKFYPRKGTVAAGLQLIPTHEVKRRSTELTEWFSTVNYNKEYVGETVTAFFTEKGKNNSHIGRTENYRQVIVKSDNNILGQELKVLVEEVTRDDLRGKLIT